MEGALQERAPHRRRSRVARLEAEQRTTTRGSAGTRRRRAADKSTEVPYEHIYPTLPATRTVCQHGREHEGVLADVTAADNQSAELASSALLATAAELQSRREDLSALLEIFPEEPVDRLQEVLLCSGGLHAAVAAMMDTGSSPDVPQDASEVTSPADTDAHAATLATSAEALPCLLNLFEDQMNAATVRHVLSCAAGDFDVALDTLGELVAAAERAVLSVEDYLELLAAQASDATVTARDMQRGEQASVECASRLLRADRADVDGQRLLSRVVLAAPPPERRDAPQAAQRLSRGQAAPRDRYTRQGVDGDEQMHLDLHGLTVESSLVALDEELCRISQLEPLCSGRGRRLLVVTGRGSHSAGPAGRAPVRAAVERHLSNARLPFKEMNGGGAFEVRV